MGWGLVKWDRSICGGASWGQMPFVNRYLIGLVKVINASCVGYKCTRRRSSDGSLSVGDEGHWLAWQHSKQGQRLDGCKAHEWQHAECVRHKRQEGMKREQRCPSDDVQFNNSSSSSSNIGNTIQGVRLVTTRSSERLFLFLFFSI